MQTKPRFFSRFFHDLRHPPKHRPSLPVQTGFPTSLIDILVKNQDRLKTPSSKCKKSKKISTPSSRAPSPTPLSSEIRVSQTLDSSPETPLPPCLRSEFPSPPSEIGIPGSEASEIPAPAPEICRNSIRGGESSTRRLLEMAISLSIVAILVLTTKRIAIGIAITAFVLSFLRSLQWPASRRRLPTPAIPNPPGEEEEEEAAHDEEIQKMEDKNKQRDEITESKETAGGGRGRRGRLKSKLMKLMHRKPKTSEKQKNCGERESIGECRRNENLFIAEEAAVVPTEVKCGRENDYTGCLVVISVVLAGLCFGHTAAMAITITWFATIKWWLYFISRCKRRR